VAAPWICADFADFLVEQDGTRAQRGLTHRLLFACFLICFCHGAQVSDLGVQAVARGAGPSLQELNVGDVRQMTNISVQIIADHCTNLTSLSIAGNMQVMDMDVADVCKKCLGMQSLNLRACRRLTDGCLKPISGEIQPACTESDFPSSGTLSAWKAANVGLLRFTDFNIFGGSDLWILPPLKSARIGCFPLGFRV
jgi:hypothetical protein